MHAKMTNIKIQILRSDNQCDMHMEKKGKGTEDAGGSRNSGLDSTGVGTGRGQAMFRYGNQLRLFWCTEKGREWTYTYMLLVCTSHNCTGKAKFTRIDTNILMQTGIWCLSTYAGVHA